MDKKDPIAAELGRRGGIKGGRARSKSLSPERRREIARRAAAARWASKAPETVEKQKPRLAGTAHAIRRATLRLGDYSIEAFELKDGRLLLGRLSVETLFTPLHRPRPAALLEPADRITFQEDGSWQLMQGIEPQTFLALCREAVKDITLANGGAKADAEFLRLIVGILVECARDGLEQSIRDALAVRPS